MAITYLTTSYQDRLQAKEMGARWDSGLSKWFVPDGYDLAPFSKWIPEGSTPVSSSTAVAQVQTGSAELSASTAKGVSLSSLLNGISQAVSQAYRAGVWTIVEVVELRISNGHVFLGVSERAANGSVLAKANATIWQTTANIILPKFEIATGAQLAPGIKRFCRDSGARPKEVASPA